MDQTTESIKQEIEATRESMTTKMEQIESQVQGRVDGVKQSAQATVDNVKRKLDISRMVDERPLMMLGAAVIVGFLVGRMGGSA